MVVDLRDEMLANAQAWKDEAETSHLGSNRRAMFKIGSGLMAALIYIVVLLERIANKMEAKH